MEKIYLEKKENTKLTNSDLVFNKYDIDTLVKNIKHLDKKYLLHTQKLTADFCVKYILDLDIESGSEDSYLYDKNDILENQPHITEEEFNNAIKLMKRMK